MTPDTLFPTLVILNGNGEVDDRDSLTYTQMAEVDPRAFLFPDHGRHVAVYFPVLFPSGNTKGFKGGTLESISPFVLLL
jgi:hypothetical protein